MMLVLLLHSARVRAINTITVRLATRVFAAGMLLIILVCSVAQGNEHPAAQPEVVAGELTIEHAPEVPQPVADAAEAQVAPESHSEMAATTPTPAATAAPVMFEPPDPEKKVAFFADMAKRAWHAGDRERGERAFSAALNVNAPVATKRQVMLDLADLYEAAGEPLKVVSVLEKFLQALPNDEAAPAILLRLGILYRDAGMNQAAIARFFLVLNSTLRVPQEKLDDFRRLAMKARLEIAETYAAEDNHEEARKFYGRLELLDLDESDRERVVFRGAQQQYSLLKWAEAERQLASFLERYPSSVHAPEARYMRAKSLEKLERDEEAVQEVLALLQMPDPADSAEINVSRHWKRRTGNELANRFYEQGDIMGALSIYQALARASEEAAWRWPAVYQIGLCFERLNLRDRAVEAYALIVKPEPAPEPGTALPESLSTLQSMAAWRLKHLDWVEDFGKRLQVLSVDSSAET